MQAHPCRRYVLGLSRPLSGEDPLGAGRRRHGSRTERRAGDGDVAGGGPEVLRGRAVDNEGISELSELFDLLSRVFISLDCFTYSETSLSVRPAAAMSPQLPTSNRSVVWVGARKLEIQQRPVVAPGPGEVLVEIVSTGICGSDCHNWESSSVSRQLVLGHESAGVIIQVGEGVKDRSVGQRVAVEPGFACNEYVNFPAQSPSLV